MNSEVTPEHSSGISALFVRLVKTILSFKWLLLILVAALTIFAFYEMRSIKMDNSSEAWFVEGDRTVELLDEFRDIFGNDDFVILLFEFDNFFKPENIRVLGRLAKALEAEVPHLKDITCLGNVVYIEYIVRAHV